MKIVAVGLERALRSDQPPSPLLQEHRDEFWEIFKVDNVAKLRRLVAFPTPPLNFTPRTSNLYCVD